MKIKNLIAICIVIVALFSVTVMADDSIKVRLDGKEIVFDVQPTIKDGSTLVPVRAIFEALEASVEWDDVTRTVISTKGNTTIKMPIDSKTMYVNGKSVTLNYPAIIVGGRTLVPVRAISEAYGCQVGWDGKSKIVSIINDKANFTMLYAAGNRIRSFSNNDVNAQLSVGWYRDAELKDKTFYYTDEEIYQQFVDFVITKGSLSKGQYGIQESIPYHYSESGTSYGTVTLVYDTTTKELQVQVLECYESNRSNSTTMQFLTIDLPKKTNEYNWQFQYMIDDESYKNNDYFMASEGTIKANAESYITGDAIKTTNIILGQEIISGSSSQNVGMLVIWVRIYGDKMFERNNSTLTFEHFGFK